MRNPVAATRMMRGLLAGLICTFSILVPSAPVRAAVERTSDGTDAVDPYAIGCILPLTGKHAPYGKKAQDAILLARRLADPGGRRTLKVLFEDSHGQPDAAAAAVTRLAERGRVIGLLGLLGQAEAIEAASAAQGLDTTHWLCPLNDERGSGSWRPGLLEGLSLGSYLQMVDWTSRLVREGKARVSVGAASILDRLGTSADVWQVTLQKLFGRSRVLGVAFAFHRERLQEAAARRGRHHVANLNGCPA